MKKPLLIIMIVLLFCPVFSRAAVLSWDKNPDAVSYTVYVREAGQQGDYQILKSGITDTTYTFTTAVRNKTYEYAVKAFNECGNSSDYSDIVQFNECKASTIGKVTGVKIVVTVVVDPINQTGR